MAFVIFFLFIVLQTEASTTVNDKTWDPSLISSITPNVASLERCQDICKERQDCKGFTWVSDQASLFPGSCALFQRVGDPNVPCADCISATLQVQDECTRSCWGMGFEMVFSKVLPQTQDCQTICEREQRCHQFTSYADKKANKQLCTLYTNGTESDFSLALIITGGNEGRSGKVETFPPYIGCEGIPDLPGRNEIGVAARSGHSAHFLPGPPPSLVVCGGHHVGDSMMGDTRDPNMFQDCVFWRKGLDVWETFISVADLDMDLNRHEAWSHPAENRILLMAGSTTKWVPGGEPGFSLKHPASGSCLINEGETFVLLGGYPGYQSARTENWPKTARGNVDRYSIDGHLESLPSLGFWLVGSAHGCGSYADSEGRMVLMVSGSNIRQEGPEIEGSAKTNVMLLAPGADAWVYGQSIIGNGYGMAKSMVTLPSGEMLLAGVGGQAYADKVARFSNGTWKEVGRLQTARRSDAVVLADLQQLCG